MRNPRSIAILLGILAGLTLVKADETTINSSSQNGLNYDPTGTPEASAFFNGYYTGCNYFGTPVLPSSYDTTTVLSNGFFGTVAPVASTSNVDAFLNGLYGPITETSSVSLNGLFSQYPMATMTVNEPQAASNGYDFFVRARRNAIINGEEDRRQREFDPSCSSSSCGEFISESECVLPPRALRIRRTTYPCLSSYSSSSECVPVPVCPDDSSDSSEPCNYPSSTESESSEEVPVNCYDSSSSTSRYYKPQQKKPVTAAKRPAMKKKPVAGSKLAVRRDISETSEQVWPNRGGFVRNSNYKGESEESSRPRGHFRQRRLYQFTEDEEMVNQCVEDSLNSDFDHDYSEVDNKERQAVFQTSPAKSNRKSNPFVAMKKPYKSLGYAKTHAEVGAAQQKAFAHEKGKYKQAPLRCCSSSTSSCCPCEPGIPAGPNPPRPLYGSVCSSSSSSEESCSLSSSSSSSCSYYSSSSECSSSESSWSSDDCSTSTEYCTEYEQDSCGCDEDSRYVVTTNTRYYPTKIYITGRHGIIYTVTTSYASVYTTGVWVPCYEEQPYCPPPPPPPCCPQQPTPYYSCSTRVYVTTIMQTGTTSGSCGLSTTTFVTLSTASQTVTIYSTSSNSAAGLAEPKYHLLWTVAVGAVLMFIL